MARAWRLAAVPFVLLCFTARVAPQAAPILPAAVATTLAGLEDLRADLDMAAALVDADSATRLRRLRQSADVTIADLRSANADVAQANIDKSKIYNDVARLLSEINSELARKSYLAYAGLNAAVADMAAAMDGLPAAKAPPSLLATYPLRLSTAAADTSITFFGHFPDVDAAHQASVTYRVNGLPEATAVLQRSPGGGLSFQAPQAYLKEASFIDMLLTVPDRKFTLFYGTATFPTRVYVEKRDALLMEIAIHQENPKLWTVVTSPSEHIERADGHRRFNVGMASAVQLFALLVNDDTTYVADSAAFVSMPFRVSAVGAPCWCGCGGSSAALTSWDTNAVSWQISAPACPEHFCSGGGLSFPQTQVCRGGETHGEIYLKPIFRVKLRNQRDDIVLDSQTIRMQRRDQWQSEPMPWQWDNVSVTGTFRDGDESRECRLTIFRDVRTGGCDLFSVSAANDVLTIKTR